MKSIQGQRQSQPESSSRKTLMRACSMVEKICVRERGEISPISKREMLGEKMKSRSKKLRTFGVTNNIMILKPVLKNTNQERCGART